MSHEERDGYEEVPEDLRALLDQMETPRARNDFKDRLKDEFVGGALQPSRAAVEQALSSWIVPAPAPAFKTRLREEFLGAAPARSEAPVHSLSAWRKVLYLAVAAALLFLILRPLGLLTNEKRWSAVDYVGNPTLVIDGQAVDYADASQLNRSLGGGCNMSTGGELLRLQYGDDLLFELAETTELKLDPRDGKLLIVELESGAVRISTSESYDGRILVETPEAEIEVKGKSLGIDILTDGVCICTLEGSARVTPTDETINPWTVGPHSTGFIGSEGMVKKLDSVLHLEPLQVLSKASERRLY